MAKINEDLQRERDKCTFKIAELTTLIDGGRDRTDARREREKVLLSRTKDLHGVPEEYLSHKEKYESAIKNSVILFGIVRQMQEEGKTSVTDYRDVITALLASAQTRDGSPMGVHYIMFMPAILNQGTEEQQAEWMPRAWNSSIIGTYAQTELGHGTFIRGLETTATYDPSTKEFVLNTPTLTSYKWWPGGLGHTANYCIVVAQLYTKGQCHGIHSFILQVRDEETHAPLPGIKVGDIGAKLGLNSVDNGFLGLDNVRIPRNHMLMKHAQVLEDGTYVKSKNSKLNYGAMVFVRVVIVFDMVNYLSKASTIAVRYSAVRRQCHMKEGEPETQILDYITQQHKVFISIATTHALRVTANKLWDTFNAVTEELGGGNLNRLPELHALACCLKAVSTADTANCVERCRLACGGHGYMQSSNLPLTYGLVTAACTYEGENTVLLLQTARFLVKTWQNVDTAKLTPTVEYLKIAGSNGFIDKWQNSIECIIKGFQIVAMGKISSSVDHMQKRVSNGMTLEDAWNMTSVQLVSAAEVYLKLYFTLKRLKYKSLPSNFEFVPFGVETLGPWGSSAQALIKDLIWHLVHSNGDPRAGDFLAQQISIAIQRGNADSIKSILPQAHCRVIIMSTFYEEMNKAMATVSPELRKVLQKLIELYGVYWALEKVGDLLQYAPIAQSDIRDMKSWYEDILVELRPNAVALVDAFDIRDGILHSTLGAYDGRVYERLMEEALKSPLNAEPVNQSFHKYLKPFMQGKL